MRWSLVFAASLLVIGSIPGAQSSGPDKGRETVNKVIAALGGDKFLHLHDVVEHGRLYGFFHDQVTGTDVAKIFIEYLPSAPPNQLAVRERQLMGKKQDYSYLYLPDRGWDITFRGARPVSEEKWSTYQRAMVHDVIYTLRCRMNEPGIQFEYTGTDTFLGRHVEGLDIIDSSDLTVHVLLDHNTWLPIHATYSWFDEKTREHNDEVTDYDKYRDIGGVQWPFVTERTHNGYKASEVFADDAAADQTLPPNIFELPENAPILKRPD